MQKQEDVVWRMRKHWCFHSELDWSTLQLQLSKWGKFDLLALEIQCPFRHWPWKNLKYTDWQKNCNNQNQSCFIHAVISTTYVEINQQNLLAVSCVERISNFVQLYHQTGVHQGLNLTSRMPSMSSKFQKTLIHWKIKKEGDNHG